MTSSSAKSARDRLEDKVLRCQASRSLTGVAVRRVPANQLPSGFTMGLDHDNSLIIFRAD